MAKIKLIEGGHTTVSDRDFKRINRYKWHRCGFCGHVFRTVKTGGIYSIIYMGAEVMGNKFLYVNGGCNPCPAVPDQLFT